MPGFNIESLLAFRPANYLCVKCLGLLTSAPMFLEGSEKFVGKCPVCGVQYLPSGKVRSSGEFFKEWRLRLEYDDIIGHSKRLARVGMDFRRETNDWPPLRSLYATLSLAKHFVHFTSFGITHLMMGALAATSHRVPVRAVVSNMSDTATEEVTHLATEAPAFNIRSFGPPNYRDMPHQKLLIIDGLLAFKGSANFTQAGWRNAGRGRDVLEVVTNTEEVISLNNRYFAPMWAELSEVSDQVILNEFVPDAVIEKEYEVFEIYS